MADSKITSYYNLLGLDPTATGRDIKAQYRTKSLGLHPDKVGTEGMKAFIAIQKAYEALKTDDRRRVYDIFGSEALSCTTCRTFRDYLISQISGITTFYIATFVFMIVLHKVGSVTYAIYWRFLVLFGVLCLELYLITAENVIQVPVWRTRNEVIKLAREFIVIFAMAVNQLGPMLFPEQTIMTEAIARTLQQNTETLQKHCTGIFTSSFQTENGNIAGRLDRKLRQNLIELEMLNLDDNLRTEWNKKWESFQ